MSGGGLLQLVAFGAQDMYLTGNPQITFFNAVYRRHTNFAMESMEQTFSGTADFGRKVSCLVARNGDLIHKSYLQVTLPQLTGNASQSGGASGPQTVCWTNNIGHVMIDNMTVEIGGSIIDQHYGQWLTIYSELTMPEEKVHGYNVMIGNTDVLTTKATTIPQTDIYVPLIFWFNRNPGLALPLIALTYHEVKINIQFVPIRNLYITSDNTPLQNEPSMVDSTLYIDYIFLDQDERRMMSQQNHEYLIEQLQFQGAESFNNSAVRQKLNFSHPCKELVWVIQMDDNVLNQANRWTDFTTSGTNSSLYWQGDDPLVDAKIQLNTHDRITTRTAPYWNLIQPYNHHTRIPSTGIYLYSFALKPEEHQPSGSINMSRIEGTTLQMTLATGTSSVRSYVYAVNYNVLRVTSGLGGLAYSN
ncbi:major capsid protein [Polychytrium aggregatum]|uniref:major capsid protein n=1 Tax=Polychytrium aggregatum TaxID=110093 RepID=UPI0022FDC0E1|nr:major capsid protein [Polychytrium aggregatum]KAI9190621.1 major capsid protein [Polychytrium aggregatum]